MKVSSSSRLHVPSSRLHVPSSSSPQGKDGVYDYQLKTQEHGIGFKRSKSGQKSNHVIRPLVVFHQRTHTHTHTVRPVQFNSAQFVSCRYLRENHFDATMGLSFPVLRQGHRTGVNPPGGAKAGWNYIPRHLGPSIRAYQLVYLTTRPLVCHQSIHQVFAYVHSDIIDLVGGRTVAAWLYLLPAWFPSWVNPLPFYHSIVCEPLFDQNPHLDDNTFEKPLSLNHVQ